MTAAEPKNIPLTGPEWEPKGKAWDDATPADRAAWWQHLGEAAQSVKRDEIRRGIGADGLKLQPINPKYRKDHADGKPLDPHYAESRTYRLLHFKVNKAGVTLYWKAHGRTSWATILGYHAYKHGPRSLPVRNTIGISPKGRKKAMSRALLWWNLTHRPKPVEGVKFVMSEAGAMHGDVAVLIDVARVNAALAEDLLSHVGRLGSGAAKPGSYTAAVRNLTNARRTGTPVAMPRMALDTTGRITINDGRHRFAALRDRGVKTLPVSVPKAEAKAIRATYGVKPPTPNPSGPSPRRVTYQTKAGPKTLAARVEFPARPSKNRLIVTGKDRKK